MKRIVRTTFVCVALLLAHSASADDDSTLVPMTQTEAPAKDLTYQGRPIDQDEAVSLQKQGVDLSTLEPVPNDMWGLPSPATAMPMPPEGATLAYDSALAGFGHEISIHRVTRGNLAYRLDVSTVPHRALLTRALLARLGYNQDAPKRYATLKLKFRSLSERSSFLDAVALDTRSEPTKWVKEMPENRPELTLQDVVLEPGRVQLQNYYWATLASDFAEGRRAQRALLVPISLCNAPENIDSYKWDIARILNNSLLVPYPHEIEDQRPFDSTTIDDMRWIARRIAQLSLQDWSAIVAEAAYPSDIAEIVLQKLIANRNIKLAQLGIPAQPLPYDAHLSNGSVKDGQVIQAHFDGYVSRFSYGDSEDPMRFSEIKDLGILQLISSGMDTLASKISEKMIVRSANSYFLAHEQEMAEKFFKHMLEHPNEPYSQPVSHWGGVVGGFSLTGNRSLGTGTFYGSDAAIQLVDTVGFTGNLGYFRGIDGLKKAIPGIQPSVSISRNFTHIRKLTSIGSAFDVPASETAIPFLLHDLSKILSNPKSLKADPNQPVAAKDKAKDLADYAQAVEDLLSHIKDGEMFTITDTLTAGAPLNIQIPIQALFPSAPVGYNRSFPIGVGVQGMVVQRTTLRRVHDELTGENYLQVYSQSLDSVTGNLTLDFNFWLNIAHFGIEKQIGTARTRVYTLKSDAKRAQDSSKLIANSVRQLLRSNSDSELMGNYPFYRLKHDLSENDWQFRFLFFRSKDLQERHLLRIQPPKDNDHPFNPKDFERELFSYRELSLSGSNFLSFISGIVDASSKGKINFSANGGDNPAYTPYGSSHWTESYSDAELTQGYDYLPVTVLRESWAGWSLSQPQLFQVFDQLDSKLNDLRELGVTISPIHRDVFAATQKLEFYNITATTIFYQAGVDRIVNAMNPAPDQRYSPRRFMENWSDDPASASDREVFKTLRSWYGGDAAYQAMCQESRKPSSSEAAHTDQFPIIFKGNTYSCIDSWAMDVLNLRRTRPVAQPSDDPNEFRQATLQWNTKLLSLLGKKVPLAQLMKIAQRDGFFFQVRVNGFRKGDHQAKDSEQKEVIASYTSDSVGTVDQYAGSGAFGSLVETTKITPYEVNALFFTGGN